jgi:hypothetical protein
LAFGFYSPFLLSSYRINTVTIVRRLKRQVIEDAIEMAKAVFGAPVAGRPASEQLALGVKIHHAREATPSALTILEPHP